MRELDGGQSRRAQEDLSKTVQEVGQNASDAERELTHLSKALGVAGIELSSFENALSDGLGDAFNDVIFESDSLKDALKGLGDQMSRMAYDAALDSVADSASGAITNGLNTVMGAIFSGNGGGSAGGAGNGGAASRGASNSGFGGQMGVSPGHLLPVSVVMNVTSPDAPSFQRSQNQIAAGLNQALHRAGRVR